MSAQFFRRARPESPTLFAYTDKGSGVEGMNKTEMFHLDDNSGLDIWFLSPQNGLDGSKRTERLLDPARKEILSGSGKKHLSFRARRQVRHYHHIRIGL
jgi:hypothetical protein